MAAFGCCMRLLAPAPLPPVPIAWSAQSRTSVLLPCLKVLLLGVKHGIKLLLSCLHLGSKLALFFRLYGVEL